jgi:two-component system, chemotaxis family, chemotaxis protein CheY
MSGACNALCIELNCRSIPSRGQNTTSGMHAKSIAYARHSVLVIDDQPFVRRALIRLLEQIGFREIGEAEDGESGFHQCVRLEPDLVVCDIEMKPVSGLQFLALLRSSPDIRDNRTPVIFLTVHTESDIVRKALSLGIDGFLVKPPSMASMKERIDRILGAR